MLTKGLNTTNFEKLRKMAGVTTIPNQVRRECYHVCMHLCVNIDKLSVGLCANDYAMQRRYASGVVLQAI